MPSSDRPVVRLVVNLIRMAETVSVVRPRVPGRQPEQAEQPALVVTSWTREIITVVTVEPGAALAGGQDAVRPAQRVAGPLALSRPLSRSSRFARAALLAVGVIALPIVAKPVQRLLLGPSQRPRLPKREVRLLPPPTGEG